MHFLFSLCEVTSCMACIRVTLNAVSFPCSNCLCCFLSNPSLWTQWEKRFLSQTMLSFLELVCPREMLTNSRKKRFKGPCCLVQKDLSISVSKKIPALKFFGNFPVKEPCWSLVYYTCRSSRNVIPVEMHAHLTSEKESMSKKF